MLITKEVGMNITNRNINYYNSKGYDTDSLKILNNNGKLTLSKDATLLVKVKDLTLGSNVKIEVLCDYCKEETIIKTYFEYIKSHKIISKDCCEKCRSLKIKESNMSVYGNTSTNNLPHVLEKKFKTNIDKYGFANPNKNEGVKDKKKQVFLDKYGETSPAKNSNVKAKMIKTNNEKYGGNSPSSNEEVRAKQISTLNRNYNVDYPMQNKELQIKAQQTLCKNGTAPNSRQQTYIHNLIGGEINFPQNTLFLDIAFPYENIYIEVDLGGHKLQVKLGNMSEEEFADKEKRRWYFLYRRGWKEIRIISKTDKIPSDNKILEIIKYAKDYLNTGHHYIRFNLDDNIVETSQFKKEYDFGNLRWIYKQQL